jgi:dTDP-4-dehydrorhamnose 3,5-epimerase-like enzyme
MDRQPRFIEGGAFSDERGALSYVNGFNMLEVRRFYLIGHPDVSIVRAWQGHQMEQKWFYVTNGKFKVVVVKPDNWEKPSMALRSNEFILSADHPGVLHVPGGYANGFKALEPDSQMMVFSDFTVEQSKNDNYRFEAGLWGIW